jgi:hypothetical protein
MMPSVLLFGALFYTHLVQDVLVPQNFALEEKSRADSKCDPLKIRECLTFCPYPPQFTPTMTTVTADYTSPTHSLNVNQKAHPSDGSVKASFEALSQAIRATQSELNVFLTERKLEEDQANGVNGTSSKRKATEDDDIENEDEAEEDE